MNVSIPKAGEELGGYRLLNSLGRGGAGIVWEAEDAEGVRFALKLLHPAVAADPASRVRLAREASVLNKVRSEGVASVVDLETEAAQPFVVTELIRGVTLSEEIKDGGPMSFPDALAIAHSLKDTLEAVHTAGVIHRDLKPSNIILGETQPVLIDFGIAQSDGDERLTSTGLVSGTPGWVAPEVLRGQAPDEASDWWAWAAILLFMLTGHQPFGTGSNEVVISRQLAGTLDIEGVYPEVARILQRALGSADRRPSPSETLEALDAIDPIAVDSWTPNATSVLAIAPEDSGPAQDLALAGAKTGTMYLESDPLYADSPYEDSEYEDSSTAYLDPDAVPYPCDEIVEDDAAGATRPMEIAPDAGAGQTQYAAATRLDNPAIPGPPPSGMQYPPPAIGNPQLAGANLGGAYPSGFPGAFPWQLPYSYQAPTSQPFFMIVMGALCAAIPVKMGASGLILVAVLLVSAETVGLSRSWRERRRVRAGGKRSGDNWLATLAGLAFWVRSVLALAVNVAIGGLIVAAAWALFAVSIGNAPLENPFIDMLNGVFVDGSEMLTPALLWASNAFVLLLARLGVDGAYLREGVYAIGGSVPKGLRISASVIALIAAVALVALP